MKRIFTLLTFFIGILSVCTLSVTEGYAQLTGDNYPVQAHVYVQRPSLKMPEYFSSSTMLRTDLILKDLTKTTLDVYLGWQITGLGLAVEAGTLPGFVPPNYLTLTKGSKRQLSGAELREYFQPGMLAVSGVGENVIFNGKLPEGFYTIKITAYEAGTGRQVSNTAETFFSVAYALPPVINLPLIGSEQPVTRSQSVLLQWMPRHTATGSNRITYSGKVCEVAEDEDPNIAINGSQNCFTIPAQPGTSYVLKASDLPLKVGKRYAFQVQVTDNNDQLEFQNQGYSEVSWFRFGEACKPPSGLQVNAIAAGRLNVSWNANPQATGYKLLYRSKSQTDWTEQTTLGTSVSLVSLNPELDYEFKVITVCEIGNESPESETVIWEGESEVDEELEDLIKKVLNPLGEPIVSTGPGIQRAVPGIEKAAPSAPLPETFEDLIPKDPTKIPCQGQLHSYEECSDQHPEGHISTADKDLQTLKVGDLITIYDYLVVLTEVSGGNNIFSGKGLVKMPFLEDKKMPVEFSNVEIKQDKADQNGGCVMAVNGYFRVRTGLTPEQIRQEEIDLIHKVRTNTDPGSIYISRGQVITELGEELTTTGKDLCDGKPITEDAKQSLLKKHTLAKQGLQDWAEDAADLYDELDLDGTEIFSRIQALIIALEANIAIINSGEGCPENPDIKAEMDAITGKIKEDLNGNPEKDLSDSPVISNVEVKNITSSTATISWKGDKRFTHYIVTYQKPGEGIVTKVVGKESTLSLSGLENGSFYYFSIKGINEDGGEFVVPERIFSTPDNDFPKPKNIVPENLDETTVKLTWDKELMHKSYKLTYTDTKGEQKFAYPTTNQIVLNDIHPDMKYAFELTGIGSQNQTASEYGDFGATTLCEISLLAEKLEVVRGEEIIIQAVCENETSSRISDVINITWNFPESSYTEGNGRTKKYFLKKEIYEDTFITALCTKTRGNEVKYCTREIQIKVLKRECEEFFISTSKTDYLFGENVVLKANNCTGEVYWPDLDVHSDEVSFEFNEEKSYVATCSSEAGTCSTNVSLGRGCFIGYSIGSSYKDKKLLGVKTGIKDQTVKVAFTLINSSITNLQVYYHNRVPRTEGNYKLNGRTLEIFDAKEDLTIYVTATNPNGQECSQTIDVPEPSRTCSRNLDTNPGKYFSILERFSPSKNGYEINGYNCGNEGLIKFNSSNGNETIAHQLVIPIDDLPVQINAECLETGCKDETEISSVPSEHPTREKDKYIDILSVRIDSHHGNSLAIRNNIVIPNPTGSYKNIWIGASPASESYYNGCYFLVGGKKREFSYPGYHSSSNLIMLEPIEAPTLVEYICAMGKTSVTLHPYGTLLDGQGCVSIANGKSYISNGESVNLEAKGCMEGLKWFKDGVFTTTTKFLYELPKQTTKYSISCDFPKCNAETKIEVNPCDVSLKASKTSVKPFEIITLKLERCDTRVEWSDNSGVISISENEIKISPNESTTYTAKCLIEEECSDTIEVKMDLKPLNKPDCEEFTVRALKNPALDCEGLKLENSGCENGTTTYLSGNDLITSYESRVTIPISSGLSRVVAKCKRIGFVEEEVILEVPTILCLNASISPSQIPYSSLPAKAKITVNSCSSNGSVNIKDIYGNSITTTANPNFPSEWTIYKLPQSIQVTCYKSGYISATQVLTVSQSISPQLPTFIQDGQTNACNSMGFKSMMVCDNNNCNEVSPSIVPTLQSNQNLPNNRYSIKITADGCKTNLEWKWQSRGEEITSSETTFQFYPNNEGWLTLSCNNCTKGIVIYTYNNETESGEPFNCTEYKKKSEIQGVIERDYDGGYNYAYSNFNQCPAFSGTQWYDKDPTKNSSALSIGNGTTYLIPGASNSSGNIPRYLYAVCEVNGQKCVTEVEMDFTMPHARVGNEANQEGEYQVQTFANELTSSSATTPCDPNTAVPLKSLMAQYVSHLICEYIYALANQEGEFVESRAREFYASLKANLAAAYPQYAANFVFDKTESEVVELLRQAYQNVKSGAGHNCAEGEEIVSGFTGNITYGDYENVRQKYDDVTDEMADDLTPNDIRITTETTQPSCGLPDGSITITATGGTGQYSYSVDGGTTFTPNKTLFDRLTAGTYTIVVKDAEENTGSVSVILRDKVVTPPRAEKQEDEPVTAASMRTSAGDAFYYIAPDGRAVQLPADYKLTTFGFSGSWALPPAGSLQGFEDSKGNVYFAEVTHQGAFLGYRAAKRINSEGDLIMVCPAQYKTDVFIASPPQNTLTGYVEKFSTGGQCGYKALLFTYTFEPTPGTVVAINRPQEGTFTEKIVAWSPKEECGPLSSFVKDYAAGLAPEASASKGCIYLIDRVTNKVYLVSGGTSALTALTAQQARDKVRNNNDCDFTVVVEWDGNNWTGVDHAFRPGALKEPTAPYTGSVAEVEGKVAEAVEKVKQQKGVPKLSYDNELEYKGLDLIRAIIELKEATLELCNNAKVPEKYWQPGVDSPVKAPTLSGIGDGAIQELKDIPELVGFGLQLATEPETAKALWDGMKSLTPDKVKKMLLGAAQEKLDKYAQGGNVMKHEAGKDGVAAAMFIYGAVKNISTNAAKIADLGDDVVKKLDDIAEESLDEISGAIDEIGGKAINKALKEAEFDGFTLESYSSTIADAASQKGRKLSPEELFPFLKRGNDFNKRARENRWYQFDEIHLANGKRLDSYDAIKGEIVSRKATSLDKIKLETFEGYLRELKSKYSAGTIIRSNKYPEIDGKTLNGKQILEIPSSNETLENIEYFIDLAKNKYNIDIRFKPE